MGEVEPRLGWDFFVGSGSVMHSVVISAICSDNLALIQVICSWQWVIHAVSCHVGICTHVCWLIQACVLVFVGSVAHSVCGSFIHLHTCSLLNPSLGLLIQAFAFVFSLLHAFIG